MPVQSESQEPGLQWRVEQPVFAGVIRSLSAVFDVAATPEKKRTKGDEELVSSSSQSLSTCPMDPRQTEWLRIMLTKTIVAMGESFEERIAAAKQVRESQPVIMWRSLTAK